jgi:signal transduction histidine kinase
MPNSNTIVDLSTEITKLRMKNPGHAAHSLRLLKGQVIEVWERWSRDEICAAKGRDELVLRDEIPAFLDQLVYALNPDDPQYDATEGNDIAKQHGLQRATTEGYCLKEMLSEYSLLKRTLFMLLDKEHPLSAGEREIIDDSIDKAMQDAALEFSEFQKSIYKVALEKSERSNKDLDHFAAIAAHDLKSPLATISGYLSLLNDEFRQDCSADTAESLDFVLSATERMRNLVDRLLEYSRLRAAEKRFGPVNLTDASNAAAENLKSLIESKNATLERKTLPTIHGDIHLIVQLFQNLIANALKFNESKHPVVQITAEEHHEHWAISVHDNGIGFDAKERESIFAPYKQLTSKYEGAGLGLATCKRVVELHDGKIWADTTPGQGSVFSFTLPKA